MSANVLINDVEQYAQHACLVVWTAVTDPGVRIWIRLESEPGKYSVKIWNNSGMCSATIDNAGMIKQLVTDGLSKANITTVERLERYQPIFNVDGLKRARASISAKM